MDSHGLGVFENKSTFYPNNWEKQAGYCLNLKDNQIQRIDADNMQSHHDIHCTSPNMKSSREKCHKMLLF